MMASMKTLPQERNYRIGSREFARLRESMSTAVSEALNGVPKSKEHKIT